MKVWKFDVDRAGLSIVALVILVVLLVSTTLNQSQENEKLQRANSQKLVQIEAARAKQIGDLTALLLLVQKSAERAASQGQTPAVTVEQAVEALKKSGFTEDVIDEAIKKVKAVPGPQGKQGPPGQSAQATTTTSTVPATTTSTTQSPTTTTSTTRPGRPTTTTTTRPCVVKLQLLGLCI